jgi:hypothetical protein
VTGPGLPATGTGAPEPLGSLTARADHRGVPLLIYGLKPVHEERIAEQLRALRLGNLRILEVGERLAF